MREFLQFASRAQRIMRSMLLMLVIIAIAAPAWADAIPTLTFPVGGRVFVGIGVNLQFPDDVAFAVPYPNPVGDLTSSNTPLNSGGTFMVGGGGGLDWYSGPLIGSDATHWYFAPDPIGGTFLIELGIDFDNDHNFGGPFDIEPFSGITSTVIGTPTITATEDYYTLTASLVGLEILAGHQEERLNSFFGFAAGTQWAGNITINFCGTPFLDAPPVTCSDVPLGAIVYHPVPEPTTFLLLGSGLLGLGRIVQRKKRKTLS